MKIFLITFITISIFILSGFIYFIEDHELTNKIEILGVLLPPAFLGLIYIFRGGSLPDSFYKFTEHSPNRSILTRDNDPRNISPKIYLPIILTAISLLIIGWLFGLFVIICKLLELPRGLEVR